MRRMILMAVLAAATLPAQGVIHLLPSKDNTLFQSTSGTLSEGAGTGIFCGVTSQGKKRRALTAFDVAGNLPAGATVLSASLVLTMEQTSNGPLDIDLRRVSADWGEGTSVASGGSGGGGAGGPATPGSVTWIHRFYPSIMWTTAGGDFSATVSATVSVWQYGPYAWSGAQVTADVQDMLDNPATNFGWVLKSPEAISGWAKKFASRETLDPTAVPRLEITYLAPPSASVTNLGFGCNGIQFSATGLPTVGNAAFALAVTGGAPGAGAYVIAADGVAASPWYLGGGCFFNLDVPSALNYVAMGTFLGPIAIDFAGQATFAVPIPPAFPLHGLAIDLQCVMVVATVSTSNVLALVLGS